MAQADHRETFPERPRSPLTDEALEERWFQEVERRWRAIEAGEEQLIDWEDAEKFIFAPVQRRS